MCGISIYLGNDCVSGEAFVRRANNQLTHRGPDDQGIVALRNVVLGHRRLSIVDRSVAGHQPMVSPDNRWTLVFNGEVYNHEALRSRFCKTWKFQGHSDTETVLALIALRGQSAFEDMVGMWSLAAWDDADQTLLISRDRYGQKPLYWRRDNRGGIRLASEITPLFDPGESPAAYAPAVAEYLAAGSYGHLGDRCFFEDVRVFPAAHCASLKIGDSNIRPQRYWRFPVVADREKRPYDEHARSEFRAAFDEAVDSQLMADVPIGATLSGGLDSSAVVGALARRIDGPVPVFTAQCAGSQYDETEYVRAVERHSNGKLQVHWTPLQSMQLTEFLTSTIRTQEEPFCDPSIAAHHSLMCAARNEGIPVILGGQGADELLFGYPFMKHSLLSTALRHGRWTWSGREMRSSKPPRNALLRIGLSAFASSAERKLRSKTRRGYRSWLSPALMNANGARTVLDAAWSDAGATQLETVERTAIPHLVHYDDRNGMSQSVEGRMPFLDHRLADIISTLDCTAFLQQGKTKWILRDACSDLLPTEVLNRRDKIGFYSPIHRMVRNELSWVRSMLTDSYSRELGYFDCDAMEELLGSFGDTAPKVTQQLWRALSVRVWAETFGVSFDCSQLLAA